MSDTKFNCRFCNQSLEAPPDMAGDLVDCPSCGKTIEVPLPRRPAPPPRPQIRSSARPAPPARPPSSKPTPPAGNLNVVLGIAGSLVLVLGVFAPLISVPIMGSINYFQNGKGDGAIVLVLAGASLLLSVARQRRGLWWTGLGSAACLGFTFVNFQILLSNMKAEMETELADNPFAGLAHLATQAIQMQWGWAVLIAGIVLILVAAGLKPERRT